MWWFRGYAVRKAKQCQLGVGKLQHSSPQPRKEISDLHHPLEEAMFTLRSTDRVTKLKQAVMIFSCKPFLHCLDGLHLFCAKHSPPAGFAHLVPTAAWLTWERVGSRDAEAVPLLASQHISVCDAAGSLDVELKCSSLLSDGVGFFSLQLPTDLTRGVSLLPPELCCLFCVFTDVLSSLSLIILSPCGS